MNKILKIVCLVAMLLLIPGIAVSADATVSYPFFDDMENGTGNIGPMIRRGI